MFNRTRLIVVTLVCVLCATIAGAQTGSTPAAAGQGATASAEAASSRPSLPTFYGDTGIWFLPTGETLPAKQFSFSLFRANLERPQGLTDVADIGLTVGAGLTDRVEVFGSWGVIRQARSVRSPLFVPGDSVHGGVDPDHPFLKAGWSKTLGAPLTVGVKGNLLSQSRNDMMALAIRGTLLLPTGPQAGGTDSVVGHVDLVASREAAKKVEVTGTVGGVFRGSPDAFKLSNGVAWGVGAQFPSRSPLRALFEVSGEWLTNDTITAVAPFVADDRSVAPTLSAIRSPADFKAGLVWQDRKGYFVHGGFNYSVNAEDRVVGGQSINHSGWGFDVRIGFHPGAKVYAPPPPPPPAPAPVAAAPPPPPPPPPPAPAPNRNPALSAITCDPCTVEIGKTSQLGVTATDPDNDPVTLRWTAPAGSFNNAGTANPVWTAPMEVGTVPATVTATDSRGGQATNTVNLQVVRPPVRTFTFEDAHFDFDKSNLKPEAIMALDDAVRTLNENPELRVTIEGHTDSIGTSEYNLGLGDRRARAARDYLISRGIAAGRLDIISYGEERPKASNATREGRAMNRRAALVVKIQ